MKEVLAIIPARSGSRSVPNKNIKKLARYPLIAYSVAAALESRFVDSVIVSTDCEEIAEVAWDYGAQAPFLRPPEISKDDSRDIEFCQHALQEIDKKGEFQYVVILRPTSPIRIHNDVDHGIRKLMQNNEMDSLRSITDAPATPYKMWHQRGWKLAPVISDPDIPEAYNAPRQELPHAFWQTGHLDVIRRKTIDNGSITGGYVMGKYVESKYCVDIDTPEDWAIAEKTIRQFDETEIVYPFNKRLVS